MENDKKCKKNRTFATECVSYTRRYVYLLNLLGRVFKIHNFFCMIFDIFIKNFHAPASPLTGRSIKIIHELRNFMRLLLLNINYLQHQNILKTMQINITDFEHPT